MLDVHIMQRLAFVRYLYILGVEQSRQPEPAAAVAVLTFHDSVELFLQLAAECLNAPALSAVSKDRSPSFEQYFEILKRKVGDEGIAERESMSRLNKARVGLKHHGNLPSALNIEAFRGSVTSFLEGNTPRVFGIPFGEVTMVALVGSAKARAGLEEALGLLNGGQVEKALEKTGIAFSQLVWEYEDRRRDELGRSPFRLERGMSSHFSGLSHHHRYDWGRDQHLAAAIEELVSEARGAKEAMADMEQALAMIAMGLDYGRYTRFRGLVPIVQRTQGGYVAYARVWETPPSADACRACIDFVVDSALRLQASDLDTGGAREYYGRVGGSMDPPGPRAAPSE